MTVIRFVTREIGSLAKPGWRVKATIGQSYRLTDKPSLFPQGTGLTDRWSDFVGRTEMEVHAGETSLEMVWSASA